VFDREWKKGKGKKSEGTKKMEGIRHRQEPRERKKMERKEKEKEHKREERYGAGRGVRGLLLASS